MPTKLELRFGAGALSLRKQLSFQGLSAPQGVLGQFQRDADAITRLQRRGFLSGDQSCIYRRLLRDRITLCVHPRGRERWVKRTDSALAELLI